MSDKVCVLCRSTDMRVEKEWVQGHDRIICNKCGYWKLDPPIPYREAEELNG